ncbi:MAG: DUF4252 domain-containing protein [Prevotellaceae bacterium]|jgi:hypothetical protein|nr:DUF4252 domain-containing protein [Prevotellaceae bacterium]
MKKILLIMALLFTMTIIYAQENPDNLKQFFKKCKADYNLKQIKIGKFVIKIMCLFENLDKEGKTFMSSIKQIRIFDSDEETYTDKQVRKKIMNDLHSVIEKNNFSKMLEVKNDDVEAYWLADGKKGHIIVVDKDEDDIHLVYFKINGKTIKEFINGEIIELNI